MFTLEAVRLASVCTATLGRPNRTPCCDVAIRRSSCSWPTWLTEAMVSMALSSVRLTTVILSSSVAPSPLFFCSTFSAVSCVAAVLSASCAEAETTPSAIAATPAIRAAERAMPGLKPTSPSSPDRTKIFRATSPITHNSPVSAMRAGLEAGWHFSFAPKRFKT